MGLRQNLLARDPAGASTVWDSIAGLRRGDPYFEAGFASLIRDLPASASASRCVHPAA